MLGFTVYARMQKFLNFYIKTPGTLAEPVNLPELLLRSSDIEALQYFLCMDERVFLFICADLLLVYGYKNYVHQ